MAQARAHLGYALALTGRLAEGVRYLREAVAFYESGHTTVDAYLTRQSAEASAYLAEALVKRRTPDNLNDARKAYQNSLAAWRELQQRGVMREADGALPAAIARRLMEPMDPPLRVRTGERIEGVPKNAHRVLDG